jgi:hypothetical protein
MTASPLRIAVLCRGHFFEGWEADCLKEVMSLPGTEIVLLIAEKENDSPANSFAGKISAYPYRHFLWRFHKRFLLRTSYFETVSMKQELKDVPLIYCQPGLKGKYSQHFSANDIETIRSHRPDIILRFAFNILRGEILTVAKYGVWSYHHSDEQLIRGGPPGFWEIYRKHPVTGAILQRLTEKLDAGIILRKGFFPTIFHSYKGNLEQLIEGTSSWMKQAIIDVQNGNSPALDGKPAETKAPVFYFPKNFQMLSFRGKLLFRKLQFHYRTLFQPESWNIGFVKQTPADVLANGFIENPVWLPESPSYEYKADPFGWKENGALKIIFEKYSYKKQKGVLAFSDEKGKTETALEAKVHLSYPFVLERTDDKKQNHIILPESSASSTVFCFDSEDPKNGKILLQDIAAIDPTALFHDNKWWLFCTIEGKLNNTALHIYHAENFDGPWLPHTNNPVKCDVRSSRPGGTPFLHHGKIYRPAQDCSFSYGSAIVLNEIVTLDENSFEEKTVRRISPSAGWKYNKGLHTFSVAGEFILFDAKRYRFNFDNFRRVFGRKIKRVFSK